MSPSLARVHEEPRRLASIVGGRIESGRPVAKHAYRLGVVPAPDADVLLVGLIDDIPGIGFCFEAKSFEHAFERALLIGEDLADCAGHLEDGVIISVEECHSLAEAGFG